MGPLPLQYDPVSGRFLLLADLVEIVPAEHLNLLKSRSSPVSESLSEVHLLHSFAFFSSSGDELFGKSAL